MNKKVIDKDLAINLINQELPIKEIIKKLDVCDETFRRWRIKNNIPLKNKGYILKKNNEFFDEIDSEIKAYLLGYLLADGCVSIEPKKRNGKIYSYNKRIIFCSSIDDLSTVELFKDFISPDGKILFFTNAKGAINRKPQCSFKISSRSIVDTLISKYNIKPRKTFDLGFKFPFETISNELHRHFIRGFFDGDGWISKSSFGFIGTSYEFIKQLGEVLCKNLTYSKYVIRSQQGKNMITYNLHLTSNSDRYNNSEDKSKQMNEIFNYLYKDSNYFLNRKYTKFINAKWINTEITTDIKEPVVS